MELQELGRYECKRELLKLTGDETSKNQDTNLCMHVFLITIQFCHKDYGSLHKKRSAVLAMIS